MWFCLRFWGIVIRFMGYIKLVAHFFSVWDWVVDLGFLFVPRFALYPIKLGCFCFCFSVDSKLILEFGFE